MRPNYLVLTGLVVVALYFAATTLLSLESSETPACADDYRTYVKGCRDKYGEQRCRIDAHILVCRGEPPRRLTDAIKID